MERTAPPAVRLRQLSRPVLARTQASEAAQTFAAPRHTVTRAVAAGPHKATITRLVPIRLPAVHPTTGARAESHIGADRDVLVVEDVARILRCTVDTARRIPRDQLPAYPGPGRRTLYLREDALAYVRSLGRPVAKAELLLTGATAEVLGSASDRVRRERHRRRTS